MSAAVPSMARRALIVEDHASLREVQQQQLQSEGLEVMVADSADDALLRRRRLSEDRRQSAHGGGGDPVMH